MTTCDKCGKLADMPDCHTLPIGWERDGIGNDYCRECMAPVRMYLNRINAGKIWICVFCGEYNEPHDTACGHCNAG